jgi:hypothetical protein
MITEIPPSPGTLDGIKIPPCVRSGFCCNKFSCAAGQHYGSDWRGPCKFLRGPKPGAYSCGLVVDGIISKEDIYAGEGCCSPMFNTARNQVIKEVLNEKAKKQNTASSKSDSSQAEE